MLPYDPNTESLPFADVDILKTPYYTCGYEHEGYRDLGTVPRKPGVFRPTTGPARWNYLEAQMERSQRGTYLEMRLFPPFWTMDFLVNDGECQVLTYCHKLAHLAAGSEDVPVKYESCYGFGGVQRAKKAGLSAHNAENISMFALRFHPQLADLLPPRLGQQLSRS
jgi:hypothetical protein